MTPDWRNGSPVLRADQVADAGAPASSSSFTLQAIERLSALRGNGPFGDYTRALGGNVHLYANASNAFKDLLVHLRARSRSSRPNVALPSYLPAKLYRAALAADVAVRFYEVHGRCTADLTQLASIVDDDTVAVLSIHYFGFPDRIEEVARIAHERGTVLIEDCALTLGGEQGGQRIGTFGDAALFSMRKMFNYSEGGFLRLSDAVTGFQPHYDARVWSLFSLRHYLRQRAKYAYVRLTRGADPLRLFRYDPPGFMDWSAPQTLSVKRLSHFSQQRLAFADVDDVIHARRRNFLFVAAAFPDSVGFDPLHRSLDEGVTPYSFPFLVDPARRDEHRDHLLRSGVVAGAGWPEAPFDGARRTMKLAASLLELPVHQALTPDQLLTSLRAVETLATRRSR